MLIQFLVENFLSFKDETVFSLLAPPEETRGVVEIPAHGLRLMRIAAFYGANASGKSNLVEAMEQIRRLVADTQSSETKLPGRPFRLSADATSKPCRFQFDFLVADVRYTYILSFTAESVETEALYRKLNAATDDEMVFEREGVHPDGSPIVRFGAMVGPEEKEVQFAEFTARGAHKREILLTRLAKGNVPRFAPSHAWFAENLTIVYASARYAELVEELHSNTTMARFYSDTLRKWGTGIREINVEEQRDPNFGKFSKEFDEVIQAPKAKELITQLVLGASAPDTGVAIAGHGDDAVWLQIKLTHSTPLGFNAIFNLQDESDGTKRLLHLLPILFHRTQEAGLCTVIDELDRSLHTTLTRHFIQEFLSMAAATQTQLIFTTHDTNLLNRQLLPIPAIWFVEKDDDGASHIYSLAEYKSAQIEQLLEHLEEGYLQGRFGAIPFIADRNNLRWQACEEKPAQ